MKIVHTDHNNVSVVSHEYEDGFETAGHVYGFTHGDTPIGKLNFQLGPVKQVGVNGVQTEGVLAALIDRTKVLNEAFPCEENVSAIWHLEQALICLNERTAKRQARGVEGLAKP